MPTVVVTHDRVEALALGDRLAVLVEGSIRQVGPVHEVFSAPADVEVARVVGTENVFPARLVRREGGLVVVRTAGPSGAELVAVDPGGDRRGGLRLRPRRGGGAGARRGPRLLGAEPAASAPSPSGGTRGR